MDKYEYKLKLEQMRSLFDEKEYKAAAQIADSINWKKVKSVSTLYMVGEIYEHTKQYEESREMFLMAYDRSPVGRNIIYRLTLVAVRLRSFEEAEEYYEEFLEIAPHDNLKYVLKYEIAKAKGADLEVLISILEEFKEREYTEEWAFELAYLYHKYGNSSKCVEICDELILWFGEGRHVEKALELKMLYQPLNKLQEDKYRSFKQKREDMVEIRPTDALESGEIVNQTIQIPKIHSNTGRFSTLNLQAELAKSMQQIIEATKQETVNDTMDSIKKMVGEIPYLQVPPQEEQKPHYSDLEEKEEIEPALRIDFNEIRSEEQQEQIEQQEEQEQIEDTEPVQEPLLKKQITGQMSIGEVLTEWEKTKLAAQAAMEAAEHKRLETAKAKALQEAEGILGRLTDVLPRLDAGSSPQEVSNGEFANDEEDLQPEPIEDKEIEHPEIEPEQIEYGKEPGQIEHPEIEPEQIEYREESEQEELSEPQEENETFRNDNAPQLAETGLSRDEQLSQEETTWTEKNNTDLRLDITKELPTKKMIKNQNININEDILIKEVLQDITVRDENPPMTTLNQEQKDIFTYFINVPGMEQQLCQVYEGVIQRRTGRRNSASGNVLIMGGKGSGKTILATDFIKGLQKMTKKSGGKVGKITASALNQKDIAKLLKAVAGGYLIIEKAGSLSKEAVTKLSLLMENDTGGLLVILEDSRIGLEKVLSRDPNFAKKFTEKIKIPVFTSDELVSFAKSYAREQECEIDDMGVLALYNSISNIQRLDEATNLVEVKEIMDVAIEKAKRGGIKKIFGGKRYTENGYVLLKEKDFDE